MLRRVLAHEITCQRLWTSSDPQLARRYGLTLTWQDGVACFAAQKPVVGTRPGFGHQVIGFGVLAPASPAVLDRLEQHYARLGGACRILVPEGAVESRIARMLVQRGYVREPEGFDLHLLRATRVPTIAAPKASVARVAPRRAAWFARLTSRASAQMGSPLDLFLRRQRARLLADQWRMSAGFVATVGRRRAGCGMVILGAHVAALNGNAVFPAFRGLGIQQEVVAEVVRYMLARGVRLLYSQTIPGGASARNLADLGFDFGWRMTHYLREPAV